MSRNADKSLLRRGIGLLGLAVLLSGFAWSLIHVAKVSFFGSASGPGQADRKEITFVHWQLEGRTVDAMQWAADEYMKLHPDVLVRQIGISTNAYDQWVRTQLIGRTAPDLMEMWARDDWDSLAVRYFQPIPDLVEQPNPYNDNSDLAGVAWRDTYIDGMKGGFRPNLQEYYAVPLSVFTVRIYANRDLIDEAARHLGKPAPTEPQTLSEFFALCEDIRRYAELSGNKVVPIAGANSIAGQFRLKYLYMGFAGLNDMLDDDYDGDITYGNILEAVCGGRLNLVENPCISSGHLALYDICRYFSDGFMSASRDMPISLFVQGKAAMIATGSWEAGSIFLQVGDQFKVTVFDFPIASPDNPEYGAYLSHRLSEANTVAGFGFGLTRFTENRETAVDFLRFLTSRRINEQLNRRLKWFPAIKGAGTDDVLAAFKPRLEGVYSAFNIQSLYIGPRTNLSYEQRYPVFVEEDPPTYDLWKRRRDGVDGEDSHAAYEAFVLEWKHRHYREFMSGYQDDFHRLAPADFEDILERTYRNLYTTEANIASVRMACFDAPAEPDASAAARRVDHLRTLIHGQTLRTLIRQNDKLSLEKVLQMPDERGARGAPR